MDNFFEFGVKRRRASPVRRRRASPVRRRRASPVRRRRSPVKKCNSKTSLSKLRKLALENGVNIYSEARTAVSKRTGLPKQPKKVGCTTLMKRLNAAGLSHVYKVRPVSLEYDMMDDSLMMGPDMPMMGGPCMMDEYMVNGNCKKINQLTEAECVGSDLLWNKLNKPPNCSRKSSSPVVTLVDPACNAVWANWSKANKNKAKGFTGIKKGDGSCKDRADKGLLVEEDLSGDLDTYANVAGFDMNYGRRVPRAGARPKLTQKHAGEITVSGRKHKVFRGTSGGLYYMKGKTGKKIYVDKSRLRR